MQTETLLVVYNLQRPDVIKVAMNKKKMYFVKLYFLERCVLRFFFNCESKFAVQSRFQKYSDSGYAHQTPLNAWKKTRTTKWQNKICCCVPSANLAYCRHSCSVYSIWYDEVTQEYANKNSRRFCTLMAAASHQPL